ncbi:MAG: hypothetical protein C4584_01155 [Armatimonadetes bacterium]|nr:MAG: hypothetical protein C4584_01155 [Armatimonadota bacterium]
MFHNPRSPAFGGATLEEGLIQEDLGEMSSEAGYRTVPCGGAGLQTPRQVAGYKAPQSFDGGLFRGEKTSP